MNTMDNDENILPLSKPNSNDDNNDENDNVVDATSNVPSTSSYSKTHEYEKVESFDTLSSTYHPQEYKNRADVGIPDDVSSTSIQLLSNPLSWRTARGRIREVLEDFLNDTSYRNKQYTSIDRTANCTVLNKKSWSRFCGFLSWITVRDLDCYLGSVLLSIILMVMSITFYCIKRNNNDDNSSQNGMVDDEYILDLHKSYIVASTILTSVSILSTWAIRRRKKVSLLDIHLKKRRNVFSLLQVLNRLEKIYEHEDTTQINASNNEEEEEPKSINEKNGDGTDMKLIGNSLSDIYPVYRLSSTSNDRADGQWHNIPSLLLVKGDFIALQTGDTAPADCKIVTWNRAAVLNQDSKKSSGHSKSSAPDAGVVKAGDTVQIPLRLKSDQLRSTQSFNPWFPPGKSTLPENSRKLLHLCRNKRVFEVLDTPMSAFLKSESMSYQSTRTHRMLREVRNLMFVSSTVIFLFTLVVVSTRYGIGWMHLHYYYLPLVASLSILPIITPLVIFIQEIIGTSRILKFVHELTLSESTPSDSISGPRDATTTSIKFFLRYFIRGCQSRFSLADDLNLFGQRHDLFYFPPINMCLYEKLGSVTASAFIDDELVCDPISTPEQLLLPSSDGFKLFDLYSKNDQDDDGNSEEHNSKTRDNAFKHFHSSASDDSHSDNDFEIDIEVTRKRRRKIIFRSRRSNKDPKLSTKSYDNDKEPNEIQFEDPSWWRYLPSLKCIGLSCILLEQNYQNIGSITKGTVASTSLRGTQRNIDSNNRFRYYHSQAETALVNKVCQFYNRNHLHLLAQCIGFKMSPNVMGEKGDITPFEEMKRIHVIATRILQQRLLLDRHSLGIQESRSWGILPVDATSILIKDNRSGAYQLLTVGDARVITDFCSDAWQGGISTITPLSASNRKEIHETCKSWELEDLDITAFSYAPIPRLHEQKIGQTSRVYLVDNRATSDIATTQSQEWGILKNQIFLGLLGSSVGPRKCVVQNLEEFDIAGVRFVYFSSRNMRRTKEIASEMGIDVAWNSAISLRPLIEGEDDEYHKTAFGEADFNAKLPHGVDAVVRHLDEVDNVPLLVRLYTDVTKSSTAEMIEIFREHSDTVLAIGLSHTSRNNKIFSASSLALGINLLLEEKKTNEPNNSSKTRYDSEDDSIGYKHTLSPNEVSMISLISSNSCVFSLTLDTGLNHLSSLIELGRETINAGTAATHFMIVAYTSLALMIAFIPCTVSKSIPFLPGMGFVIEALVVIPFTVVAMGFAKSNEDAMSVVPVKNVKSESFFRGEGQRLIICVIIKALLPAVLSQVIFLITFGSIVIEHDSELIFKECGATILKWVDVIRCDGLKSYVGPATIPSGVLVFCFHSVCMIVISSSFLLNTKPVLSKSSISMLKNQTWVFGVIFGVTTILLYMFLSLEINEFAALPWYFYILLLGSPFICLSLCECTKSYERKFDDRAAKMRRLHFDTRLGMWSPK